MDITSLLTAIGERYGLLPVYALVIAAAGFLARDLRHLLMLLGILVGLYATMFKAFNLGGPIDIFGLRERLHLSQDAANGVSAAAFVAAIGFGVFGVKRLIFGKRPV